MGYNTSIEDAVNLGWKLAAVCNGWGGLDLLASYEKERRPIAVRNTRFARSLADNIGKVKLVLELEDDTKAGQCLRDKLGEKLLHQATIEFNTQGIQLGVQYCTSPIVVMDDNAPPLDDPHTYVPTATPGCRAPHLWLDKKRSNFDEFGREFTLLQLNRDKDVKPITEVAQSMGIPLHLFQLDNEEARTLYAADLILIRPDHHVAWRSVSPPSNPEAILHKISGGR